MDVGFLGAGDVYFNRQVAGVYAGRKGPYPCKRFELKANAERKELTARGKSNYGQLLASAAVPKPFDLNLTLLQLDTEGLAIALMGTTAVLTQASGSLASEAVVTKHDVWVPLTKANFTAGSSVVKDVTDVTTYTEGTDYLMNDALGWIKVLSTGAIADGATVHVSVDYEAQTGTAVDGATQPIIRAKIDFDGINFATGKKCQVEVYEATFASDAAIDFLNENFAEVPLPGRPVTPSGYTAPFRVKFFD